jgi:DNA-directed RNA polymerase subunit RPC12/RpoP
MHPDFECPECGGRVVRSDERASPINREGDPWSTVLHRLECFQCGARVPAHLGLRLNGISPETAIGEWKLKYRPFPQSGKAG